jgi:hypothetical protein
MASGRQGVENTQTVCRCYFLANLEPVNLCQLNAAIMPPFPMCPIDITTSLAVC